MLHPSRFKVKQYAMMFIKTTALVLALLDVTLAKSGVPSNRQLRPRKGKSKKGKGGKEAKEAKGNKGFIGWETSPDASEGFEYVFDLYLRGTADGTCLGPDFSRGERNICLTFGGYVVETFPGYDEPCSSSTCGYSSTISDSGYCCPPFDISSLEDDGCFLITDTNEFAGMLCNKVVAAETGKAQGGISIIVENDSTGSSAEYCCPSGIVATPDCFFQEYF